MLKSCPNGWSRRETLILDSEIYIYAEQQTIFLSRAHVLHDANLSRAPGQDWMAALQRRIYLQALLQNTEFPPINVKQLS